MPSAADDDSRAAPTRAGTVGPATAGRQDRLPWLLAIITWAMALCLGLLLVRSAINHSPRMIDLGVYRTAGQHLLHGLSIYPAVPADKLVHLGRSYLVFTYPPFAAILALPLALLSWHVAQLAWVPLVYGPLAVVIWFAFRPILDRSGRYAVATFGAIFIVCMYLWPILQEIRFGQVDIALAALCVADVASRRPRWPRGLLIGLATAIKLTPGVFIVYLLLTGRRKAALVAAVAAACFSLATWLLMPHDSSYYWTSALFDVNRLGRPAQLVDQSVRAMLLRAYAPGQIPAGLWLALVLVIAVAGFAAARLAATRGNDMAGIAIVGMIAVLISPVSWIHHIVWVVPAIGAILGDGHTIWRWLAAVGTTEFFIFGDPYQIARARPWFDHFAPHLTGLIRHDAYGIASAAVLVILALLPKAAAQVAPAPGQGRSQTRPQPALRPGCSTEPDGSGPADQPALASRAQPPDAP